MKILIINGEGYFSHVLRDRLYKDGNEIYCLQNDLKVEEILAVDKLHYLTLPYSNSLLEYFRLYNFDVVFYISNNLLDVSSQAVNVSWEDVLSCCVQFKVKKAIYVTQRCYTSGDLQCVANDAALYLCESYEQQDMLDAKYIEFSQVFAEDMYQGIVNNVLLVDSKQSLEEFDYLSFNLVYADDAVDIVLKLWEQGEVKYLPKAPNSNISYVDLYEFVQATDVKESAKKLVLNNLASKELAEINWEPKYSLAEKLQEILQKRKKSLATATTAKEGVWKKLYPYVENLGLFALLAAFVFTFQGGNPVNSYTEADITYLYILIVGLLYGKKQALPAILLSTLLYFGSRIFNGSTFVSLMYQPKTLLHIACYLFFGAAVGYVTDNRDYAMENMENQVHYLKDKYNYLFKNYLEVVKIKDGLYRQIINSNDSIGRIYNITKRLDTLKVENLYLETCSVVSEIMHVEDVAVYGFSNSSVFLRLRANTNGYCEKLPKSLNVSNFKALETMIKEKSVFVNKEMKENLPDMAVPVYNDKQCLGIICIYNMDFDDFNLHNEVLLKVITSLVSNEIKKANEYVRAVHDIVYIENTIIMKPEYFIDKCADFEKLAKENLKYQHARLVNLGSVDKMSKEEFNIWASKLNRLVRVEDVVGICKNHELEILYFNLEGEFKSNVEKRMQEEGITIEWLS